MEGNIVETVDNGGADLAANPEPVINEENLEIKRLKAKRSLIKRRITLTVQKLEAIISQFGRKSVIKSCINSLGEFLKEVELITEQLILLVPETEYESILDWYEEQLNRINRIQVDAEAHLSERADEASSTTTSLRGSSSLSSAALKAKVTAADLKAKQQAEEGKRRKIEFEKQLELKRKIQKANEDAEIAQFESDERRKTQDAKDEAARLVAEATVLQDDPERLENRLFDFHNELLENIALHDKSEIVESSVLLSQPLTEHSTVITHSAPVITCNQGMPHHTPVGIKNSDLIQSTPVIISNVAQTELNQVRNALCDKLNVDQVIPMPPGHSFNQSADLKQFMPVLTHNTNSTVVFTSQQPVPSYTFANSCGNNGSLLVSSPSWAPQLQSQVKFNPNTTYERSSLPKIKLSEYDGDPLLWSDWSSMFKSVVNDANVSLNVKMQHLQNAVTGKAKQAIVGYGYSGDLYYQALSELETRFGKPELVVKATLTKLRNFNHLQDDKRYEVRSFSDIVTNVVWTLKRFGYEYDLAAEANVSLAVDKLSRDLKPKWKEHVKHRNIHRPTLVDLEMWLKEQAEIYEEFDIKLHRKPKVQFNKPERNYTRQTTMVASETPDSSEQSTAATCIMNDGKCHKLFHCPKFRALSVADRLKEVRKHRLCFKCFSDQHWSNSCSSQRKCKVNGCMKTHNSLLHRVWPVIPTNNVVETVENTSSPIPENNVVKETIIENSNASHVSCNTTVLLQVIPVVLYGPKGHVNTFAMMDSGSTCSLVLANVAKSIGLDGPRENVSLSGIQKSSELLTKRVNLQVGPTKNFASRYDVYGALVVDQLNIPDRKVNLMDLESKWPHLAGLELPMMDNSEITLLIGSDSADIIVPLETRIGPRGAPIGIRTRLGWTVTGRLPGYLRDTESVYHIHVSSPDEELHEEVKAWWRTENFGCKYTLDTQRSVDDKKVTQFLDEKTRKVGGRYEVPLLWIDVNTNLPNNRIVAEHRLIMLEKRLQRNPELASAYKKTILKDESKGYIKKLSVEEMISPVKHQWYLPHHPVQNVHKPGKVRRVCDAAAKFQGSSLNDYLLSGPDLLNSLVGIFMRFRENRVALSADIEAMFNQVAVPDRDQTVLRFLWRESPDSTTEVYQYLCHIFGAKCAPTCSNYALLRTAEDHRNEFSDAAHAVKRNFYMDDFFKSVKSVNEALSLQDQLVKLLQRGGFHLTKWVSNEKQVMENIPIAERALSVKTVNNELVLGSERALGIDWNTDSDCIVFNLKTRVFADTRRKVLSLIASLFDPIGFLSPFLVRAKIFLQSLWQLGIGWDESLPPDDLKGWSEWQSEWELVSQIAVPRFYQHCDEEPTDIQLHMFGDASEVAFCAVGYFRFTYSDGSVKCTFVFAKTRVAPKRRLSIPRLELQAAVLCTRLSTLIIKEHDYKIDRVCFWSDSSTVICWLTDTSKRHPSFIANRVEEILDITEPHQWRHCPGKLNPADDGSRGLKVSEITMDSRWLNGPEFLSKSEDKWPINCFEKDVEALAASGSEVDCPTKATWVGHLHQSDNKLLNWDKYSSLERVIHVTAYVLRFINNCKRKSEKSVGSLTVQEVALAKKKLIQIAQSESFPVEFCSLKDKQYVTNKSKLVNLTPFLDVEGVIRVGGRLEGADISYSARHPVVLAHDHELSRLIILDCHKRNHHEGVNHVRNELRREFWILRGRATVRKILHGCMYCKRRRVKPEPPMMAELPRDRINIAPPFYKSGVDYFGPLLVKHLKKQEKRYGCLFTCLVTRAVHLEVAFTLETDSFIMCLRRFMSRRGKPSVIYSDNGTNFVGADRELRDNLEAWNQEQITTVSLCACEKHVRTESFGFRVALFVIMKSLLCYFW